MTKDQLEKANYIISRMNKIEGELKRLIGEDSFLNRNPDFLFPEEMITKHILEMVLTHVRLEDEKVQFLEKEINKLKEEVEHFLNACDRRRKAQFTNQVYLDLKNTLLL